ncbi:uncharacterized protein LOC143860819 isoform X2 [Tasmannia lanceolata]
MNFPLGGTPDRYMQRASSTPKPVSIKTDSDLNSLNCRNKSTGGGCHEMGLVCNIGKKAAAIFPESEREDADVEKQLETESLIDERCSDPTKCMCLSQDCVSPFLSLNDKKSCDGRYLDCCDMSLDEQFFLDGRIPFFDGSRINPIEEACLVLERTSEDIEKVCGEDLQSGEVVTWLHNSIENDMKDSSFTWSESAESSYDLSVYEDSSVFESSWTSLSTHADFSSPQIQDSKRTDVWVSLLDLDEKDFEWISDKEQGCDVFQSEFPSPYCKTKQNFDVMFYDTTSTSLTDEITNFDSPSDQASDAKSHFICDGDEDDLEDFKTDEPLFWPFDHNSYCQPKEWDFLCMSPQKNRTEIATPDAFYAPKSIRLRLHQRSIPLLQRRNVQEGCTRGITSGSTSTVSTVLNGQTRDEISNIRRVGAIPSRFCCPTTGSSEQHSFHVSLKKRPVKKKENSSQINCQRRLLFHSKHQLRGQGPLHFNENKSKGSRNGLEKPTKLNSDHLKTVNKESFENSAGDYQELLIEGFGSNEEVPIETLVGLNEFDGHEGVDVEFNEDHFSLDTMLCNSPSAMSSPGESCVWEGDCNGSSSTSCTTLGSPEGSAKVNDNFEGHEKIREDQH